MSNGNSTDVGALFQDAQDDGTLSPQSAMMLGDVDVGAQIQEGLGVSVDDVQASEVTLVTMLIDDSGSIRMVAGNTEAVREGHNGVLDALGKTKTKDGILVHARYLNGTVLYPYRQLVQATRMDTSNYNPVGATPLFDQTEVILGTVLAKAREFEDAGVPCRSVTCIVTDGADAGSQKYRTARQVAPLVRDILKTEMHIVTAMGIDDGSTDFRGIFLEMGIPAEWILTPKNDPSSIRKAFLMVSQSAVRASQAAGAAGFSKVAGGGFGNP